VTFYYKVPTLEI